MVFGSVVPQPVHTTTVPPKRIERGKLQNANCKTWFGNLKRLMAFRYLRGSLYTDPVRAECKGSRRCVPAIRAAAGPLSKVRTKQ